MSSRCTKGVPIARIAALVLGAVLSHRAGAAVINVCVDSANPTAQMDAQVVRAAFSDQGRSVRLVHFVGLGRGGGGYPVRRFAKMAESKCRLIMGFPVDSTQPQLPPGVRSTAAYVTTGFVLIGSGRRQPAALAKLRHGTEVGIANLNTDAGLLFTTHHNIVMHVYASNEHMLGQLDRHRLDLAMTWQPFLERYEARHPDHGPMSFHLIRGPHMEWNLVALYSADHQHTADLFDRGLRALRRSGRLQQLTAPYRAARAVVRGSSNRLGWHRPVRGQQPLLQAGGLLKVADKYDSDDEGHGAAAPALYTAAQAMRGAGVYAKDCAMCHGDKLQGRVGPALKGEDFADPSSNFHVGDIFGFIARMMPAMSPGSLKHDQYVLVMAFLLQQNGYPAGPNPLTYESAMKSKVPLVYQHHDGH